MSSSILNCLKVSFALILSFFLVATAASANDKIFFNSVEGDWKGPGKIVAGKYKGTKFNCKFKGTSVENKKLGIDMNGTCRVGVFNQKMNATIVKSGRSYSGKFLDGAKGEGLDIVSGKFNKSRAIVGINRNNLDGAMVADFIDDNTMNVTISVKVGSGMVPVIGMTLSRNMVKRSSYSE